MTANDRFDFESLRIQQGSSGSKPKPPRPPDVRRGLAPQVPGVWVPQELVIALSRLRLKPPSRMSVLLEIVFTWCRYGRKEAWLEISQIAQATDLCQRTTQSSVSDLIAWGLIRRVGRRGKFVVVPEAITRLTENRVRDHRHGGGQADVSAHVPIGQLTDGRCPCTQTCNSRNQNDRPSEKQLLTGGCPVAHATVLLGEPGTLAAPTPREVSSCK